MRVIRLYREIQKDDVGRVIGRQLLRSGTSIGANVEEAQAAESKADFKHKLSIALKEARETHYWLRLVKDADIVKGSRLDAINQETEEICKILYTIINSTKKQK